MQSSGSLYHKSPLLALGVVVTHIQHLLMVSVFVPAIM